MQLKRYQERVLREVAAFLSALDAHRKGGAKHAALDAWDQVFPPGRPRYHERRDGLGRDLPSICVHVPTGGGKTLLATQILGDAYRNLLRDRNGAGLVLWVVPSDQIYKDTLGHLRDRRDFHRESLEHALSRRVEVWEKHDIARLTPEQISSCLNVLVLVLASTNRETKERLRFFQDSGGNITQHFPPEGEPERHRQLLERIPNLDHLANDPVRGEFLVKTSVGNLVRLCEPVVIVDEGHKAQSDLARRTIEGLNPTLVVEFSATPGEKSNVLTRVSGRELLEEQMIKLPINISQSAAKEWKECLSLASDRREALAKAAERFRRSSSRHIRPIVLVQVERTGKDQRAAGLVHSEQVREHLTQRMGVSAQAVAVKSAEEDEIEGKDLLDEGCPIEWIITKSALQEGWDCPFAYILVSLSNTGSNRAMTQLVGRILRQPYVERTGLPELDEAYVYCLRRRAAQVVAEVKSGLEREGYGDLRESMVRAADGPGVTRETASIRRGFRSLYGKPFKGQIYLPRFCIRTPEGGHEGLDYYSHLLSALDVERLAYDSVDWDLTHALASARDSFLRVSLGGEVEETTVEHGTDGAGSDERTRAWLVAQATPSAFSAKQIRVVVSRCVDRILQRAPTLGGRLAWIKFELLDRIRGFLEREVDAATERAFVTLFESGRLEFFLECRECRFPIPPTVEVRSLKPLQRDMGRPLQRSLFDFVPEDDVNQLERAVALYLDEHPKVLWWYRNLVGADQFAIQGYKQDRIYPDFVVQQRRNGDPAPRVLVVEAKGPHLRGSADTDYKRDMTGYFERVGRRVSWQQLGKDFAEQQFRFQILDEGDYADEQWRDRLRQMLDAPFD